MEEGWMGGGEVEGEVGGWNGRWMDGWMWGVRRGGWVEVG